MANTYEPIQRQSLPDDLAQRVDHLIRTGGYRPGDRLPSINEMARRFGVGHPTLREALRKLETLAVVEIRHGSGVYVGAGHDALVVSNPILGVTASKKLLLDLIEARMAIELRSTALASANASGEQLDAMRETLATASANLGDAAALNAANMTFHRLIALASGNAVIGQLLEVLSNLFQREQRIILGIYGSREKDHHEHLEILDALRAKDETLAVERMRAHLEGVRDALLRWDPRDTPVL